MPWARKVHAEQRLVHMLILRRVTEAREQGAQGRLVGEQLVLCQLTDYRMSDGSPAQRRWGVTQPEHETAQDREDAHVHASQPIHNGGLRVWKSVAASNAAATCKSVVSRNGDAIICRPMGSCWRVNPQGMDMAGKPARFTGMVNTSARYIWSGSSRRSPRRNAAVGETGASRASHCVKTW